MQKADEEQARVKQAKAAKMLIDVETSNQMSLAMKEKKILENKELDDKIFRYNQEKQQQEYEQQMEAKRLKDEKERETQKLRDQ